MKIIFAFFLSATVHGLLLMRGMDSWSGLAETSDLNANLRRNAFDRGSFTVNLSQSDFSLKPQVTSSSEPEIQTGSDGFSGGDAPYQGPRLRKTRDLTSGALSDEQSTIVPLPTPHYYKATELDVRPSIKTQVEPEFPLVVDPGTRGRVTLRLLIDEEGQVEKVFALQSEPLEVFERVAVEAFSTARYTPGMKGGKAVRSQVTVQIDFESTPLGSTVLPPSPR